MADIIEMHHECDLCPTKFKKNDEGCFIGDYDWEGMTEKFCAECFELISEAKNG